MLKKATIIALTLLMTVSAQAAAPIIWQSADYGKYLTRLGFKLFDDKQYRSITVTPTTGGGVSAPTGSLAPRDNAGLGELWFKMGAGNTAWSNLAGGGSGTVTSVGVAMPASDFLVTGSPITTSGTIGITYTSQSQNKVFAGPSSGGSGLPGFRFLFSGDMQNLLTGTATQSVGSSNSVGVSVSASRSDHVHQGVHSASATGAAQLYGDVLITGSGSTFVNQSGQTITISSSASSSGVSLTNNVAQAVSITNTAGVGTEAARSDHVHQGVHSTHVTGFNFQFGDVALNPGTGISLGQNGQDIFITSTATSTPLDTASPVSIGQANFVGVSTSASRGDHVHQGVHSVTITGTANRYGDVFLGAGTGITLGTSGNTIFITNSASSGGTASTEIEHRLSGGVSFFDTIDPPYVLESAKTLSQVRLTMANSGSSGTSSDIIITKNFPGAANGWITSTASLSGNNGFNTVLYNLNPTFTAVSGDSFRATVTSTASGAPSDLSVKFLFQ